MERRFYCSYTRYRWFRDTNVRSFEPEMLCGQLLPNVSIIVDQMWNKLTFCWTCFVIFRAYKQMEMDRRMRKWKLYCTYDIMSLDVQYDIEQKKYLNNWTFLFVINVIHT